MKRHIHQGAHKTLAGAVLVLILAILRLRAAGAAPPDTLSQADRTFIMEAAQGNLGEIEMGHYGETHGTSSQVKSLGRMLVTDHSASQQRLQSLASRYGITLPAGTDNEHQAAMKRIFALSGTRFDRAYADYMVGDHKKDIAHFRKVANTTMNADVKAFATQSLPTLEHHLKAATAAQQAAAGAKPAPAGGRTTRGKP